GAAVTGLVGKTMRQAELCWPAGSAGPARAVAAPAAPRSATAAANVIAGFIKIPFPIVRSVSRRHSNRLLARHECNQRAVPHCRSSAQYNIGVGLRYR